jgi:hypothetical protein
VLPEWAAVRWAAGRGVGGVSSRRRFEPQLGGRIPAHAFRPPPPADAVILIITRTLA